MRPLLILFLLFCCDKLLAQQLNLVALFKADRFKAYSEIPPAITSAADRAAVTANGLVILKGIEFKNGRLEIDLQGKDVFQQSFLGIAFNIKDSLHYEVVYFRPFNFSSTDTIRKKHAVQYMSLPDHPWSQLRKEQPNRYEARLSAYQKANDWFHATLAIDNDSVAVFINHKKSPLLKVKRFHDFKGKQIALWNDALSGNFANLELKSSK